MHRTHIQREVKHALKNAGLRATKERIVLLSVFYKNTKPLLLQQIADACVRIADRATAYRAVATFVEKRLLREVHFRNEPVRYELDREHHHHLVCTHCGIVEDVEICVPKGTVTRLLNSLKKFRTITAHDLEFFGTCKNCYSSVT